MRTRSLLTGAVAALVVATGACSSGDDEAGDGDGGSSTSSTTTVAPPSTVTDAEFETTVAAYGALLDQAGTDPCAVFEVMRQTGSLPYAPANQVQTEQAVTLIARIFAAPATAPVPGAEAEAQALAAGGAALRAEGEANGWDPQWLPRAETISDPAFGTAFGGYQAKANQACGPATTTSLP